MRLSARMNIYFTIQMLLTKLTNEQLDEFIQYVKENNVRSNVYSMQRINKCLERKDMAVDNKIKEKWNKLYEDTCNDIITNKVDLYSNQYYCHRNMIGITTYANVKHVDIKDYMQSIIKLKYVYRILGDFVGSSVGSIIHYYLSESLINQVGLDPSTINRFIDQNPPVSHDEKFIEILWDQFLKGEKDESDHYSVEWNQIELLENL